MDSHVQPSIGAAQQEKIRRSKPADFCACIIHRGGGCKIVHFRSLVLRNDVRRSCLLIFSRGGRGIYRTLDRKMRRLQSGSFHSQSSLLYAISSIRRCTSTIRPVRTPPLPAPSPLLVPPATPYPHPPHLSSPQPDPTQSLAWSMKKERSCACTSRLLNASRGFRLLPVAFGGGP